MERPLCELKQGETGRITRLEGGKMFTSNVRSRGIREGKDVTVVSRHPMGGPVVISIDGRETALGRGMASKIMVEV